VNVNVFYYSLQKRYCVLARTFLCIQLYNRSPFDDRFWPFEDSRTSETFMKVGLLGCWTVQNICKNRVHVSKSKEQLYENFTNTKSPFDDRFWPFEDSRTSETFMKVGLLGCWTVQNICKNRVHVSKSKEQLYENFTNTKYLFKSECFFKMHIKMILLCFFEKTIVKSFKNVSNVSHNLLIPFKSIKLSIDSPTFKKFTP
jgi:hypothetical protein